VVTGLWPAHRSGKRARSPPNSALTRFRCSTSTVFELLTLDSYLVLGPIAQETGQGTARLNGIPAIVRPVL
jgi:hypothetical protein